jgi:hypothetical protein
MTEPVLNILGYEDRLMVVYLISPVLCDERRYNDLVCHNLGLEKEKFMYKCERKLRMNVCG